MATSPIIARVTITSSGITAAISTVVEPACRGAGRVRDVGRGQGSGVQAAPDSVGRCEGACRPAGAPTTGAVHGPQRRAPLRALEAEQAVIRSRRDCGPA